MRLSEIKKILNAVAISKNASDDANVNIMRAYCADLMSDVLAFSITNSLLITHLTNSQVVRTAEMANMNAIIFVQGKRPDIKTISLAEEKNIPLLVTNFSMFGTCGRLFEKGLQGCSNRDK